MLSKGSKLYSVIHKKCPQCHEGDFFVSGSYDLKHIGDIKENCDKCGLKYEKEPGFYYGAMYVAYGLAVATFVTFWVSMNLFFDQVSIGIQIGVIVTAIIVLGPYLYVLSKIIWANMFISYKKDKSMYNHPQPDSHGEDKKLA
jgi:uncharacterized protein (DUF983 family)